MLTQLKTQLQKSFNIVDIAAANPSREWALTKDDCLRIAKHGFTPELLPDQTVPRTAVESLTRFMNGSKFLQGTSFGIEVVSGADDGALVKLFVLPLSARINLNPEIGEKKYE